MTKWYEADYIDLRIWLLDHLGSLKLTADEGLTALELVHFNLLKRHISLEALSANSGLSTEKIDKAMAGLSRKGYLSIRINGADVRYLTDGLFEEKTILTNDADLIDLYQKEFKRTLSSTEIDKLNDWLSRMDRAYLVHALREALMYNKVNFNYIDRILAQWQKDKTTIEQLNQGKRNTD
jgi:DNA replication protein